MAPFLAPENQAEPAISRCAHFCFSVNLDKKQAAVIVPARGPPIFAISAKLLFKRC